MISFVIPAHNEELLLPATLRSVHAAARTLDEPYEIIVADDASTDRTASLAAGLEARVVPAGRRIIAAARNAGARAAKGDMLFFIDADTQVSRELIRAAAEALRQGAAGGGAAVRMDGRVPAYGHALVFLLNKFARLAGLAFGCFLFCRRDAFEAAGGFDETLYASEEWALSRALRRQGRFVMLREKAVTSGRKLRTYSLWETLKVFGGLMLRPGNLRKRKAAGIWYDPRRQDPGPGS